MGQVEGVDGEWVEDSDGEFDNGLEDGEEDEMAKMMGFGGFGSSKVRSLRLLFPLPIAPTVH